MNDILFEVLKAATVLVIVLLTRYEAAVYELKKEQV